MTICTLKNTESQHQKVLKTKICHKLKNQKILQKNCLKHEKF